jgi:nucleotide-binding universal stress UspA family protein
MLREMRGTIVCGVIDGAEGHGAAQIASALAARLRLRLVLVHVVPAFGSLPAAAHEERRGRDLLERALKAIGLDRDHEIETRVVVGSRVDALAEIAADEGADLIVLGSRPRGARGRQLRCALAVELEAAQAVPVLIAPPASRQRSRSRLALAHAASGR